MKYDITIKMIGNSETEETEKFNNLVDQVDQKKEVENEKKSR